MHMIVGRSFRNLCLAGVALVICNASVDAKDLVLTRRAVSGVSSEIAHERSWDKACKPRSAVVTFTRQPAHGTVSVVRDVSTIPATTPRTGGTNQCRGQSIEGNKIVYESQPGFHGDDIVSWDVVYNGVDKASTTVTVKVR